MATSSLPPDDVLAANWARVAEALKLAREAWEAVSPESVGPVAELLRDALWNATVWKLRSEGVERMEAWRAADAAHGRPLSRYIDFDPEESSSFPSLE